MVPPSFVDHGPKLRVLILAIGDWPGLANNWGEPRKMTHTLGEMFGKISRLKIPLSAATRKEVKAGKHMGRK